MIDWTQPIGLDRPGEANRGGEVYRSCYRLLGEIMSEFDVEMDWDYLDSSKQGW